MRLLLGLLAAATVSAAAPAFSADLVKPVKSDVPAAPITTTITLEGGADFGANSATSTYKNLVDSYFSVGLGYTLAPGWTVSVLAKGVAKAPSGYQDYLQSSVAYTQKLSDSFSVVGTAGLGGTWGNTGYSGGVASSTGTDAFLYYFVSAGANLKLSPQWTWNVLTAQYKNAFNITYITPSVSTGLTYTIDPHNAVYGKLSYGWKDNGTGAGLLPSTATLIAGYRYGF